MILSVILVILVVAITFRQATFGLFSALIMTVLTICCAGAAIGMHEWLATNLLAPYWKPNFAHAIALAAAFGVPMVLLRLLFDRTITRSCFMPVLIDRAGGAVCGLITALIMVGVLALALQMVPFGRTLIGYSAVTSFALDPGDESTPLSRDVRAFLASGGIEPSSRLWFGPDRFASFITSLLSVGAFSGERSFYLDNPDFAGWVGRVNAAPSEVSRFTQPGSLKVAGTGRAEFIYRMKRGDQRRNEPPVYEPIEPPPGVQFRVIRLTFEAGAKDEMQSIFFTLRQFRLVGKQSGSGRIVQLYPIAIQEADKNQPVNRHIASFQEFSGERPLIDDVLTPRDGNEPVEVVFAVPDQFEPWFIEYKRGARATVAFRDDSSGGSAQPQPPAPAEGQPPAAPAGDNTAEAPTRSTTPAPAARPGPRTRRVAARSTNSLFSENLPMTMRSYRQQANVSIENNALANGHLIGKVADQANGADREVSKFAVPEDKRLLHLNTSFLQARSGLGRAISFAVGVAQNYTVTDSNGNRYPLAGRYVVADVGGTEYVEVQYFPEATGTMGSNQPLAEVKEQNLTGNDYTFVLLFLVDPGVNIVSFSSGSSATAGDDLTSQNLVAPQ